MLQELLEEATMASTHDEMLPINPRSGEMIKYIDRMLWDAGVEIPAIIVDIMHHQAGCTRGAIFNADRSVDFWTAQFNWTKGFISAKSDDIARLNKKLFKARDILRASYPDGGEEYSRILREIDEEYEVRILKLVEKYNKTK